MQFEILLNNADTKDVNPWAVRTNHLLLMASSGTGTIFEEIGQSPRAFLSIRLSRSYGEQQNLLGSKTSDRRFLFGHWIQKRMTFLFYVGLSRPPMSLIDDPGRV